MQIYKTLFDYITKVLSNFLIYGYNPFRNTNKIHIKEKIQRAE